MSTALIIFEEMQLSAGLRSVDIRKPDIRKQIAALEQQIATARTEQQRMENLVKAKAGNQKQVDDIVNNIKTLQKQLDAQYSAANNERRCRCGSRRYPVSDYAAGRPVTEKPYQIPIGRNRSCQIC